MGTKTDESGISIDLEDLTGLTVEEDDDGDPILVGADG